MTKFVEPCEPEMLHKILQLDAISGELTWMPRDRSMFPCDWSHRMWNKRYAGMPALSCVWPDGYKAGSIFYGKVRAHRVVWAMHYGYWPLGFVDHINGNKLDNSVSNLRDVNAKINSQNMTISKRNKSGWTGVSWRPQKGKWRARVNVDYKEVHLGHFDTIEDAIAARIAANRKYGYHPNHGKQPA